MKLIYNAPLFLQGIKKWTLLIVAQSTTAKVDCSLESSSKPGATLRSHFCFEVLFTLEKRSNKQKKCLCLFHDAMTKKCVPYIDNHHIASSATNTQLPLDER